MKFLVPVSLMLASIVRAQYPVPITFNGPAAANTHGDLAYQDISIVRRSSDGRYFRFSKSNHTGAGMSVATAPAFRGPWTYSYAAMTGALKACSSCKRDRLHLWAPEVHHVDGIYYLYYTINDPDHGNGLFDIAVSTSSNLEQGSWTDHGSVGIPSSSEKPDRLYVRLGVNLLANSSDPSGVDLDYKHLAFGSFNQGLFGSYLDQDLLTVASNNTVNEIIADQYNPNKDSKAAGNRTGGTYALHHGQYIYQFYSIGSCCGAVKKANQDALYRVEVCRGLYSDGPNGPFFDRNGVNCLTGPVNRAGTVVIASHGGKKDKYEVAEPGSIGIFNDQIEGLVMYYQYKNLTAKDHSLRFGYNYLDFDEQEWPVLVAQKPNV